MNTITAKDLQTVLANRINEAEAELEALKAVTINTGHKTLTNKAVTGGRIGDYIGIGKALFVSYQSYHRYMSTDLVAYTYTNPDGTEIGVNGFIRTSRTLTPTELRERLDDLIASRASDIGYLKADLVNATKIVAKYNKMAEQMETFRDGLTWATRGVLK